MEIVYPRWCHHLTRDSKVVNNKEDFEKLKVEGYQLEPIIKKEILNVDIIKEKVKELEKQIQSLLAELNEEDAKLVMDEIYPDVEEKSSFKCKVCGEVKSTQAGLNGHMRKHKHKE